MEKVQLLIVTELYPKTPDDHVGAFVRDQLLRLTQWYAITVITVHHGPSLRRRERKVPAHSFDHGVEIFSIPYYQWWLLGLGWFKIISIHRMLAYNKKLAAWKMRRLAVRLHKEKKFALVHGHETYLGDEAGPIGSSLGIPSIFTLHGFYSEHARIFGQLFMHRVIQNLRSVKMLLADSSVAGKTYEPLVGRPFRPVPNGLDILPSEPVPQPIAEFLSGKKLLLSIGSLSPSKHFELSLQALAALNQHGQKDYRLLLVGQGTEKQRLLALAKTLKLENEVQIFSDLSRSAVRGLFEQAEMILHPSIVEAFCIVVLEGLSAGKPVIASQNIGIVEYLSPGENVYTVPPCDAAAFSAAVVELAGHPDRRREIGLAAQKIAKQFTWASVASQLHQIYNELGN